MSVHLERDITALKDELLLLGGIVGKLIDKSLKALEDRDATTAQEVIDEDEIVNSKEVEIEEKCLKMLALHQPVAVDLRYIVGVIKVNNDLERMADEAVNIAERAKYLATKEPLKISLDFKKMGEKTQVMVRESLESLLKRDTKLAKEVLDKDDEVDDLNRDMYIALQKTMQKDPSSVPQAIHLLSTSRHLERIADLSTNIAEYVIFMVDGEVIRHNAEDYQSKEI